MKSTKGCYGYFRYEKKRRFFVTLLLFFVPLLIFFTGLVYFGKRETLFTVIAIVGCLPACKSMVGLIMACMQKSLPEEEYRQIRDRADDLVMLYELFITSPEKNGYVNAIAVCGSQVVGYSSDPKTDVRFTASHIQKILHQNGCGVQVKIIRELKPFLERLSSLKKNRETFERELVFTPDERYPELTGDELIKHLILAIAL